jgi:threonine aldolase
MPYPLDDSSGLPTEESIKSSYQPKGNDHHANTALLAIENTHNGAGGVPSDAADVARVASLARGMGMKVHVDGARIFDAVAFFGNDVKDYASCVDSIQICLSKGLCAPMGSIVCGGREFVEKARKYRKALGGGQRQTGIAAAAGLIALKDMRARLPDDHKNAALLASLLEGSGFAVERAPRRTNMVFFSIGPKYKDAASFVDICRKRRLLLGSPGPGRIRMVTHFGVDENSVRAVADILKEMGA